MENESRAITTIAYDGTAIAGGIMDVRDLAPALLAMGQACKVANRMLNADAVEATTYVRSDMRAGSFEVTLELVLGAPNVVQAALTTLAENRDAISDAKQLLETLGLVGGGAFGLFQLIRKLKGKKPEIVEVVEGPPAQQGHVRLTIDGTVIDVPATVVALAENADARRAVEDVVRPLEKAGIDSFEARPVGKPREQLATKSDAYLFKAPMDSDVINGEILADSETVTVLGVIRPHFEKGHRWGLHDGQATRGYEMRDDAFLERVATRAVTFGKGDALRVRLRSRTWRDPIKGLQSLATVMEVLEVLPAPKQISLFPRVDAPAPKRPPEPPQTPPLPPKK